MLRLKGKLLWVIALIILTSLLIATTGCGQKPAQPAGGQADSALKPAMLRMAGMEVGTSFYLVAATVAQVVQEKLPGGSKIDVLPYSGGAGNVQVVNSKDAQIGMSLVMPNKLAYKGEFPYEEKMEDLRAIAGGFGRYYVAVITTKKSGIKSLKDVVDKKVPLRLETQSVGSLGEVATRQILEAYGVNYDTIKSWGGSVEHTSINVITDKLKNGQADLWMQLVTIGHPTVSELALTTDLVFLPIEEDICKKLTKDYAYEVNIPIPAKTFKGQEADVPTASFVINFITTKDMSDDLVYQMTKAVVENKEKLVAGHALFKDFDPQMAGTSGRNGIPLHPGALKYYKEKGLPVD